MAGNLPVTTYKTVRRVPRDRPAVCHMANTERETTIHTYGCENYANITK